jgi:hypothetical protein
MSLPTAIFRSQVGQVERSETRRMILTNGSWVAVNRALRRGFSGASQSPGRMRQLSRNSIPAQPAGETRAPENQEFKTDTPLRATAQLPH